MIPWGLLFTGSDEWNCERHLPAPTQVFYLRGNKRVLVTGRTATLLRLQGACL